MTGFLILKLAVIFLLYFFLFTTIGLIYRDLAIATAGRTSRTAPSRERPIYSFKPRLVILESPEKQKGKSFELSEVMIIGRDDFCDITLVDPAASLRHARISRQNGSCSLEDLDSLNGTFLNDEPVEGSAQIKPGDRIKIGQTLLELVG